MIRSVQIFLGFLSTVMVCKNVALAEVGGDFIEFPPVDNSIEVSEPIFVWDLRQGDELRLGPISITASQFHLQSDGEQLRFTFPNIIFEPGVSQLALVSASGQVVYEEALSHGSYRAKKNDPAEYRLQSSVKSLFEQNAPVRVCLSHEVESSFLTLCSPSFHYENGEWKVTSQAVLPAVKSGSEPAPLHGESQKVHHTFIFSRGASLQIVDELSKSSVTSLLRHDENWWIRGKGYGPDLSRPKYREGYWVATTGFEKVDQSWTLKLPFKVNEETLVIPYTTSLGLPFEIRLRGELKKVPQRRDWIYSSRGVYIETYSSSYDFPLQVPKEASLDPAQGKITGVKGSELGLLRWEVSGLKSGQTHSIEVNLETDNETQKGLMRVYRGFPSEISLRSSALSSSLGKTAVLGEVSFQHWFERVGSWSNATLSEQRWGLSGNYLRDLVASNSFESHESTHMSLKYRVLKGLAFWNESFGPMLSYRELRIGGEGGSMLGAGFFWERSLPKWADFWLSALPFMNYPKWVDLELIYYPKSLDADFELKATYLVNFHGKIRWSESVFGEAGFGYRSASFVARESSKAIQRSALYFTAGLGIYF